MCTTSSKPFINRKRFQGCVEVVCKSAAVCVAERITVGVRSSEWWLAHVRGACDSDQIDPLYQILQAKSHVSWGG